MLNFSEFQATTAKQTNIPATKENVAPVLNENNTKEIDERILLSANSGQIVFSKSQLATTLAIVSIISGGIMFAIGKKKKFPTQQVKDFVENNTQNAQKDLEKAKLTIENLEKKVQELLEKLKNSIELSEETKIAIEKEAEEYRKIINETTSIYTDSLAPEGSGLYFPYFSKKVPFARPSLITPSKQNSDFVQSLLEKFNLEGKIEIPLKTKAASPEDIQKALIKEKSFSEIGIPQRTSMLKEYGDSANWSDEKIARDIIQNFYDGNDHSLDSVGLLIEKTANGKYKIRLSGNGVFDHEKLMFLGATTKKNPYDAGGFGEGIKVISACMLNKGHTQNLRFGSADWELIFDASDNKIRTTLNRASELLNGNFVEFETENESFAKNIIKALDYFKHSKNPDFNGLTFENDDFGFRILEQGQKGNFYLTQRFEFGKQGFWENNVDGMDIIFKKRPDGEIYKEISGHDFSTGRDRTTMFDQDVFELTKCFAKNMSDEEILDSILSTQDHWLDFKTDQDKAIKSFTKALIQEAKARNIGIDFSKEKICFQNKYCNEVVYNSVKNAGYKIIPCHDCGFDDIGVPEASRVFRFLSDHSVLEATPKEAKRMKVLEEALRAVQENFEETYMAKLQDIFSKFNKQDLRVSKNLDYSTRNALKKLEDFEVDRKIAWIHPDFIEIYDEEKFNDLLYEYLSKKINSITPLNLNDNDNKRAIKLLTKILDANESQNELLHQFRIQLENLQIIKKEDIDAPRFIFDRTQELAKNTLGEAITCLGEYQGHWIDRTYLNNGSFFNLLSTWMHEVCHKSGGDGTAEFTYKLTDILEALLTACSNSNNLQIKLNALEKVFNEI